MLSIRWMNKNGICFVFVLTVLAVASSAFVVCVMLDWPRGLWVNTLAEILVLEAHSVSLFRQIKPFLRWTVGQRKNRKKLWITYYIWCIINLEHFQNTITTRDCVCCQYLSIITLMSDVRMIGWNMVVRQRERERDRSCWHQFFCALTDNCILCSVCVCVCV